MEMTHFLLKFLTHTSAIISEVTLVRECGDVTRMVTDGGPDFPGKGHTRVQRTSKFLWVVSHATEKKTEDSE